MVFRLANSVQPIDENLEGPKGIERGSECDMYPRRVIEKHNLATNALNPTVSSVRDVCCVNGLDRLNRPEKLLGIFIVIFTEESSSLE